ncbi:MAG: glycoside hydrolase family 38 C-terminal domain-containing protein, partial [Lachnospiraceae bacterium]
QIRTLIRAFESRDISANGTKNCDGNIYVYNTTSFDKNYFGYTIPAFGCGTVNKYNRKQSGFSDVTCREEKDCYVVHNDFYTCKVDNLGRIVSLVGTDGYEYVKSPWNEFLMYKDVNVDYDAWELGAMYENLPVELSEKADISFKLQDGNCIISVTKMLNNSTLRQKLVFRPYSSRIDFVTDIDWNERHKILKTAFTSTVYSKEAIEEIQFGYMKRPTHRSKQSDKDRYEVSNQKYTAMCDGGHLVSVMNDGKYGVNVSEDSIRLTLLRAPLVPDMNADKGRHEFVYSVYTYAGNLTDSKLLPEAYDLNYLPVVSDETVLHAANDEAEAGNTGVTDNSAENTAVSGLLSVSHKNVVIETVKPSDKYEDGVILRIYEAMGMATVDTIISIPASVPAAYETDMLEDNEKELEVKNGRITLSFGSFEIKTVLLRKL